MVLNRHSYLFVCCPRHIYSQMLCLAVNIFSVILYTCCDGTVIDTTVLKRVQKLPIIFNSIKSNFICTANINHIFITIMILPLLSK